MVGIVKKYGASFPLPQTGAEMVLGKWVYYVTRGNFQNTPAGRRSASKVISQEIFKQSGIKLNEESVFVTLQNVNAYLLKELKIPESARGPESVPVRIAKKARAGVLEIFERGKETGAALQSAFTIPVWENGDWESAGALS